MSRMSPPVRASTTLLSQGSSANFLCNVVCSSMSFAVLICIMSFVMPKLASQLGWTDQLAPSSVCSRSLASDHFQLMALATTFVIPGQCHMFMMFLHVMDSSHHACVVLCFLFRSTSRSTWQSVLISIGDPYIIGSKSSRANFSVVNSSMNGLYFSSLRDVRFEQNARGCHLLRTLPWSSVLSNSWQSILPNPFLLPSVTMQNTQPSYWGSFRTGSDVTATFSIRKAFFCSLPHLSVMDVACSARLYAPFHVFQPGHGFSTLMSRVRSDNGWVIVT